MYFSVLSCPALFPLQFMGYDRNRYGFGVQAEQNMHLLAPLRGLSAFSLLEPYQTIPGLVISLFIALATVLIDVRVVSRKRNYKVLHEEAFVADVAFGCFYTIFFSLGASSQAVLCRPFLLASLVHLSKCPSKTRILRRFRTALNLFRQLLEVSITRNGAFIYLGGF